MAHCFRRGARLPLNSAATRWTCGAVCYFLLSFFLHRRESFSKEGSAELPTHLHHYHPCLDNDNAPTMEGCHAQGCCQHALAGLAMPFWSPLMSPSIYNILCAFPILTLTLCTRTPTPCRLVLLLLVAVIRVALYDETACWEGWQEAGGDRCVLTVGMSATLGH